MTVAILASLFFGESIGFLGAAGLVLGVIGLLLLEVNFFFLSFSFSLLFSIDLVIAYCPFEFEFRNLSGDELHLNSQLSFTGNASQACFMFCHFLLLILFAAFWI